MWSPPDEPWQYRILDALPPSIDPAQLERARRMTPTERIQAAMQIAALGDALARARRQQPEE